MQVSKTATPVRKAGTKIGQEFRAFSMLLIHKGADGFTLQILVSPRAAREQVGPVVGEALKVKVHPPATEGQANEAVIVCLAKFLDIPKTRITIVRGGTARRKTIHIADTSGRAVERLARIQLK